MSSYTIKSSKFDLTPKRHHGYSVVLFILGTLFPPLAVAARFGIGSDFWLNLLLTICGYIPGHGHNFYIQNIRSNKNNRRTPKWAQRYGLVDTSEIERKKKKSQWASRYNDRLPHSTLDDQPFEEGEVSRSNGGRPESVLGDPDARPTARVDQHGQYWNAEEERYYGQKTNGNGGAGGSRSTGSLDSGGGSSARWHYPANFEDSLPPPPDGSGAGSGAGGKKKKKGKKDRWARTEDAYSLPQEERPKKRKPKKTKTRSTVGGGDADSIDRRSDATSHDDSGFPEDPEGGLYGDRYRREPPSNAPPVASDGRQRDELDHEF
ncbi:hypothetical protein DFH11DRAFT_1724581 [Phellopilus nigrolimitatus]|nr:hypothetical protein DFH11DRAFT_1724581 [Phellopilus nigrolimitatus]